MAYDVGQGQMQIVPSFKGVQQAISDEAKKWGVSAGQSFGDSFSETVKATIGDLLNEDTEAAEKGTSAGGRFADSFKARVDAALKSLPDADIGLNATEFDQGMADIRLELETLRNQTIGVDISDTDALAKLGELKLALTELGLSSESISVRVDTAQATAEIATLEAEVAGAGGASGGLTTLGTDAESAGGEIGSLLVPAIVALALALIPVAGLAGGALAALPAIFGGLGLGLSAVVLGFQGVLPAISAYNATLNTAGETAAQIKTKQDALANSLAGLSPAGQSFVAFVGGQLLPIFDQLKSAVQGALLPGITTGLQALLPFFQSLQPFIVEAAKGIGALFTSFGQFLGSAQGLSETNAIFSSGAGFMKQMGDAAVTLFEAFTSIGSQAGPIVSAIGDGVQHLVDAFAKWAEGGGFQNFLTWLKENGPSIVSDLGDLLKGVGKLVIALAPAGKLVLDFAAALGRIVSFAAPVIRFLTEGVLFIAKWLTPIGQLVTQADFFASHWKQMWADVTGAASTAFNAVKSAVFDPLVNFFTVTIPAVLGDVVGFFTALPGRLTTAVGDIVGAVFGALKAAGSWLEANVWGPVSTWFVQLPGRVATAIGDFFSAAWGALKSAGSWLETNVAAPVFGFFEGLPGRIASGLGDIVGTIFGGLTAAAGWINTNVIGPVGAAFSALPHDIASAISGAIGDLASIGTAIINGLIGAVNDAINFYDSHRPSLFGVSLLPSIPDLPTIGGGKAAGGPVSAGTLFPVGERGPELFMPNVSGSIIPNSALNIPTATADSRPNVNMPISVVAYDPRTAAIETFNRASYALKTRGY